MAVPSTRTKYDLGAAFTSGSRNQAVSVPRGNIQSLYTVEAQIPQFFLGGSEPEVIRGDALGTTVQASLVESTTYINASAAGTVSFFIDLPSPTGSLTQSANNAGLMKLFVMSAQPAAGAVVTIRPQLPVATMNAVLSTANETTLYMWDGSSWSIVSNTGSGSGVEPLWETLVAGNTTYGAGALTGNSIVGLQFRADLENHAPFADAGIHSAIAAGASDGLPFEIIGAPTTTGLGGNITIQGGRTNSGTSGGVAIRSGVVNTTGTAGNVVVNASNAAAGNGAGGGVTITAGQGVGAGNNGNIFINGNGPAPGTGSGTSISVSSSGANSGNGGAINIDTAGCVTGNVGDIAMRTGDTAGAGLLGNITMRPGGNTATRSLAAAGLLATDANHSCHFAAQQSTAPTVSAGIGAIGAGSSDMAGVITGVQAGGVGATILYNNAWAVGVVPFVVASMTGATAGSVTVTARTNIGFQVTHTNVGGPVDICYMSVGPTFPA